MTGKPENFAEVVTLQGEIPPSPIIATVLNRSFNDYRSRLVVRADCSISMGEAEERPDAIGDGCSQYELPKDELIAWLRQAIDMLEGNW